MGTGPTYRAREQTHSSRVAGSTSPCSTYALFLQPVGAGGARVSAPHGH